MALSVCSPCPPTGLRAWLPVSLRRGPGSSGLVAGIASQPQRSSSLNPDAASKSPSTPGPRGAPAGRQDGLVCYPRPVL